MPIISSRTDLNLSVRAVAVGTVALLAPGAGVEEVANAEEDVVAVLVDALILGHSGYRRNSYETQKEEENTQVLGLHS